MGQIANKMLADAIDKIARGDIKKKRRIGGLITAIAVIIVVVAIIASGGAEHRSGLRIGYVGNSTSKVWSGTYLEIDGTMTKKLSVKGESIDVSIVTESGTLNVLIEDSNGEALYRGDAVETCSFSVGASGSVKITLKANHHKGAFSFKCN